MGSIQLGAVIIGRASSLLTSTEGSMRCSTGTRLSKSSYGAVASLARASAREFFALGMCMIWTRTNFLSNSCTF